MKMGNNGTGAKVLTAFAAGTLFALIAPGYISIAVLAAAAAVCCVTVLK
jgi:dolichol kinase